MTDVAERRKRGQERAGGWSETIRTVVYAVLIALVVRTFAIEPFNIPSGSMIPTLLVGDYLFVSKYSYGYSKHSFPFSLGLFSRAVILFTLNTPTLMDTPLPTQLEFMAVSSYGSSTSSSGVVRILKDLDRDIHDRDVLIVEDIVDSGLTLSWLLRNLAARHPRSLRVCTLLRKPDAVRSDVDIDFVGFDIPNEFVVGYGLDYAERYRDLPYIGTLDPRIYQE